LYILHSYVRFWVCLTCNSYPKIEFYHTDGVRTMMVDILFIFAKLKPETSYRQVVGQDIFQLTRRKHTQRPLQCLIYVLSFSVNVCMCCFCQMLFVPSVMKRLVIQQFFSVEFVHISLPGFGKPSLSITQLFIIFLDISCSYFALWSRSCRRGFDVVQFTLCTA
jgi:hypothetical protein